MSKETANRLIDETSTYLLQHAYNPVDWHPWGEEALKKAREKDIPILLSIGYSACHWCHVMEHESFENEETAALMNDMFINVKVDREERTDLDEIYMKAVQLMTGHGGWPMTVFLTPDLKPIFAGTYFPPDDRHGMPSFRKILLGVSRAWQEKRDDVLKSAQEITDHLIKFESMGNLKTALDLEESDQEFDQKLISNSFNQLYRYFDDVWGGIGSAPKFPQPFCLELAMRILVSQKADAKVLEKAEEFLSTTLNKMAYGGIYDHLAGGFARYSVDRKWLIPHFEKMLYDNALLASIYFDAYRLKGNKYWLEVAQGVLDFVSKELTTKDGAFYSSLDADSEGIEGEFYVWTEKQILDCLGDEDGQFILRNYGISKDGNFENGKSVLNILMSPEELAKDNNLSLQEFQSKADSCKKKLLELREKRVRPGLDEKVLTSWNSLMISAFVSGYKAVNDYSYLEKACQAADFVLQNLLKDGRLLRTWGRGHAKLNAYLDDYAYFARALLDLAEIDGAPRWLDHALKLNEVMIKHFWDEEKGGFYYTSLDHEELVIRPRSHFDGSVPSGSSVAVSNLIRLNRLTNQSSYLNKAKAIIGIYGDIIEKRPEQFANLLCSVATILEPGKEIACLIDTSKSVDPGMIKRVHKNYRPNDLIVIADVANKHDAEIKLLEGRSALKNATTIYVCENFTCKEPADTIEKLEAVL